MRNNTKKDGNKIFFCMLGAAILATCILCLLLLCRKTSVRNSTELKAETQKVVSETILAESPSDSMSELYEITSEDTSESMISEYTDEETLKQQYLTNVEYLTEKVESLSQSISNTKETLEAADEKIQNEIDGMEKNLKTSVEQDIQTKISNINTYIQELESQLLQYQYEANTNTLSLSPLQ